MNEGEARPPLQLVEALGTITRLQADVITDLYGLLLQHITAEEADGLPCMAKLKQADAIRAGITSPEMEAGV